MNILVCDRCRKEIHIDFRQPTYKLERFDPRPCRYVPVDLCPDCARDFANIVKGWFFVCDTYKGENEKNDYT